MLAEALGQAVGADRASGLAAGEQPGRGAIVADGGVAWAEVRADFAGLVAEQLTQPLVQSAPGAPSGAAGLRRPGAQATGRR
jgi:hypothetical protein